MAYGQCYDSMVNTDIRIEGECDHTPVPTPTKVGQPDAYQFRSRMTCSRRPEIGAPEIPQRFPNRVSRLRCKLLRIKGVCKTIYDLTPAKTPPAPVACEWRGHA